LFERTSGIILDYAPPRRSLARRVGESLARPGRLLFWFCFRRPLSAAEIAIGGWLVMAGAWAYFAAAARPLADPLKPVIALCLTTGVTTAVAFARLIAKRRWSAIAVACTIAAATAVLSGMLQLERCPHATYLQGRAVVARCVSSVYIAHPPDQERCRGAGA
jgi:hypothetical protein